MASTGAGKNGQASGEATSRQTTLEQIKAMTDKLTARIKDQSYAAECWAMPGRCRTEVDRHPRR